MILVMGLSTVHLELPPHIVHMHMYDVFPSDGKVDAVTFGTGTGGTLAGWSSVLALGSHNTISISYYYWSRS